MNKELLAFINGEVNAFKQEDIVISRAKLSNGSQHVRISIVGTDTPLYEFWHKRGSPAGDSPPKHTGGKKPYIMVMVDEIEKLKETEGLKNAEELIGYLVSLSRYIEWSTGKLVKKRSKKPLKYSNLQAMFTCGNKKLNRILNQLKEHDLLFSTQEGYFISRKFIKKGKGGR